MFILHTLYYVWSILMNSPWVSRKTTSQNANLWHGGASGIPLQQLNHFKQTQDRREVRAALGYSNWIRCGFYWVLGVSFFFWVTKSHAFQRSWKFNMDLFLKGNHRIPWGALVGIQIVQRRILHRLPKAESNCQFFVKLAIFGRDLDLKPGSFLGRVSPSSWSDLSCLV